MAIDERNIVRELRETNKQLKRIADALVERRPAQGAVLNVSYDADKDSPKNLLQFLDVMHGGGRIVPPSTSEDDPPEGDE